MKLGYTIVYVADVAATTKFYHTAFGLETRFVHESGDYAELATGDTALAFASFQLGDANFSEGYLRLNELDKPAGFEIAFTTDDVPKAVQDAVAAGAKLIAEPVVKPWGQTVGYVQAPDGMLIELCTSMS
ncbi:MAG: VOC family protein [Rhodothermales bacterium]